MERLKTKKELKYYDKLAKKVFARKNKFFRRNVHINHKETYLRIIRIKNDEQFYYEVEGFKEITRDVCFFIYHINTIKKIKRYLSVYNTDFIITDSRTNKIIAINDEPKNYPDFINIWIARKNTINFIKVKLGDILFTK